MTLQIHQTILVSIWHCNVYNLVKYIFNFRILILLQGCVLFLHGGKDVDANVRGILRKLIKLELSFKLIFEFVVTVQ